MGEKCIICKTPYLISPISQENIDKEIREEISNVLNEFNFLNDYLSEIHNIFLFIFVCFMISLCLLFPVFIYFSVKGKMRKVREMREKEKENYTIIDI